MSSNCKHKAEHQSIAGPTCDQKGSSKQWKQFWVTAKTKKRQMKPLTREESKRRNEIKHDKKKQEQRDPRNEKKTVVHLPKDPAVARLLTELDFCPH